MDVANLMHFVVCCYRSQVVQDLTLVLAQKRRERLSESSKHERERRDLRLRLPHRYAQYTPSRLRYGFIQPRSLVALVSVCST
jgi:hypothetical protein